MRNPHGQLQISWFSWADGSQLLMSITSVYASAWECLGVIPMASYNFRDHRDPRERKAVTYSCGLRMFTLTHEIKIKRSLLAKKSIGWHASIRDGFINNQNSEHKNWGNTDVVCFCTILGDVCKHSGASQKQPAFMVNPKHQPTYIKLSRKH